MSVINLAYFTSLQPAKQKELVDKYLPNVDIKSVYEELSDEDKKILTSAPMNAKLHISELDEELKDMNSKILNYKGKIDYAYNIAKESLTPPPIFLKQEELDLAKQELEQLKSDKKLVDRNELQKKLLELQKEEYDLGLEISKLDKILSDGKKKYQEILNTPGCPCPTCKQTLNDSSKIEATKNFRAELIEQNDKRTKLKDRYSKKRFEKVVCEGKIIALDNETSSEISLDRIHKLEENIKMLENEILENAKLHAAYSISLKAKEQAESDIKNFKNQISLLENAILETKQEIEVTKKLYFNQIKAKMDVADKYLKDVKIRFYKVVKTTGEIKDDFVITYKDKDFSTLSRSEQVAASLEIANMLNKVTNLNSPLFIDDSESYPDFDFINEYKEDTQVFIAQVIKGHNLVITNNKEQFEELNTKQFITNNLVSQVA